LYCCFCSNLVRLTVTDLLNLLSLLLELLSLASIEVINTTICICSFDLVDLSLVLEFQFVVNSSSSQVHCSDYIHSSLAPSWLPHPQGACDQSTDHLCVCQVLVCTHIICLDLVVGPANPVTTVRTTSNNCRPRYPSKDQAQPNPLACSNPSKGDRRRTLISNCPSKVNQNTFKQI